MHKPTKNKSIISELYAETATEQTMIFAIQAHNHIQAPVLKNVTHILTSYDQDFAHSVMHAAIYGFRGIHKKRIIFLIPSQEESIQIQNPQKFASTAKSYKAAIHKSQYHITQNNRIYPGIAKHMQYISLLTQVTHISIMHIPTTQIFQETTHRYINSFADQETIVMYCSNIDLQEENQTHDILTYKLREHVTQNSQQETLQYKNDTTYTIYPTSNYLHIAA